MQIANQLMGHTNIQFLDLNECELSSGLCECVGTNNGCNAVCQNIPGSYVCNCSKGFFTDNNRHCHGM